MWIRNEEDLRDHLNNPKSREGHAFEYKGAIDRYPNKGRGADFASSVGSLANADGGQVLLGVRDKDGAPDKVIGVTKVDEAGKDIEDSISNFLVGIEPRPTWQPLTFDGKPVVVVDVLPSVRLVAYWNTGERAKIMYPVRTGDRLSYMRPGDVEARILSYGPRAQRIVLQQLVDRVGRRARLFHCHHGSGIRTANARTIHIEGDADVEIQQLEEFGVELAIYNWNKPRSPVVVDVGSIWVPYEWITPFLTGSAGRRCVGLRVAGFVQQQGEELIVVPLPP